LKLENERRGRGHRLKLVKNNLTSAQVERRPLISNEECGHDDSRYAKGQGHLVFVKYPFVGLD